MTAHCCDPRRLEILRRLGSANAIEFLEVLDRAAPPGAPRQRTLLVRLLKPGFTLLPQNLRIDGGERIPTVGILWCAAGDALPAIAEPGLAAVIDEPARTLVVRTDGSGDFSTYRLRIVSGAGSDQPAAGFDPVLASVAFSFKVECPSDFDCATGPACPDDVVAAPEIDYLAKDYQGFRRLMLDRLDLLVPGWTERSAADLGVVLVELLAYAADNLSYRQDVIAGEAYLSTARQRISVRRHARLVDYAMHEGCNARAFVHFALSGPDVALPAGTQLLTETAGLGRQVAPGSQALRDALAAGALVFETAVDATLTADLSLLRFYTWGDAACCLPRGTTRATLRGHHPGLRPGSFLIFEEQYGAVTGSPEDADRTHRWVVRLTDVTPGADPFGRLFEPVPTDAPLDVTEIAWSPADALPFPLCLGVSAHPGLEIAVALGNVVLADHGRTIAEPAPWIVPPAHIFRAAASASCGCDHQPPVPVPARFNPVLSDGPLTHGFDLARLIAAGTPGSDDWWSASALGAIDPRAAVPRVTLAGTEGGALPVPWEPQRDLLDSGPGDRHVVAEVGDDGRARLRFGDDDRGRRPDPGTSFAARYRIGNGAAGNVGADAIVHVVTAGDSGVALRNPTPAAGGVDPEPIEVVRRDAPQAFRTQERAVTEADYAAAAERRPEVQRAAARFRWTGSWHTAFVTPDRFGGSAIDPAFADRLRRFLERFRMAGYDLEVAPPRYVPLDVALHLCVLPAYFRSEVLRAVGEVLSSGIRPGGRVGLFHPDNFSFGEPVYLSRIIAAAQAVEGVSAVRADRFQRLANPDPTSLETGVLPISSLEIAQLANNPNFRERGRLVLTAGGGK